MRIGDRLVNLAAALLTLLLLCYSAYSIWYSYSLTNGSFLSDELAMFKPTGEDPSLEDLIEINPDVKGWLTIKDTNIDYPVVQGEDDSEYLNKSVTGEFSLAGSIFLSAANKKDFSDSYNLVYGHHIDGGAMFSDVLNFRDQEYYLQHPQGILWLPGEKAMRVEVFACLEADARDEVVYQDPAFVKPEKITDLTDDVVSRSLRTTDIKIEPGDRIIAMSTCENAETFDRVILFGKLVPMTDEEIKAEMADNLVEQEEEIASRTFADKVEDYILAHPRRIMAAAGALLLLFGFLIWRIIRWLKPWN